MDIRIKKKLWEYTKAIVFALILALFIRAYFVQAFKIPSGSMIPTLLVGDHLLVNKFLYGIEIPFTNHKIFVIRKPQRGDIIVFRFPHEPDRDFIKRIIAIPGDTIEIKDKTVFLNGEKLVESYTQFVDSRIFRNGKEPRDNLPLMKIPEGMYFVMGDNRDQSFDSRYWGLVHEKDIRGKAFILYWSWDHEKKFPRLDRIGNLIH